VKIDKNILIGLVLGLGVPVVGYAIIMIIFEQLTDLGWMNELSSSFGVMKRMRTMGVLAIAVNLIPFNYFKRAGNMNSMRGIVLATFLYAAFWIIYFWSSINQ